MVGGAMNVRDPERNFEALWLTHCGRAANRSRVTAHQCMRPINDPIQPGAEQILLASLLSLPRPRRSSSLDHLEGKESRPPIRRNRKNNLARKPQRRYPIPAKPLLGRAQSPISFKRLGILHGRLTSLLLIRHDMLRG